MVRDINNFRHMLTRRSEYRAKSDATGGGGNVQYSVTANRVMESLKRKREEESKESKRKHEAETNAHFKEKVNGTREKVYIADLLGVELTTGKASSSLTSTVTAVNSGKIDMREATEEEIRNSQFQAMKKLKKKGYVRLTTNMGIIDLEIHCDIVPQCATNFLGLVENGKYDGSVFHRLIQNFMIQGGKPPSKSHKEECLWGGSFPDEFDDRLTHTGPGVLSMANAGPGTNKQQFFITFKSCNHLDRKHSVFGRVVAGTNVLKAMESVSTEGRDRPKEEIRITRAELMGSNPVKMAEEAVRQRVQERSEERRRSEKERKASALGRDYERLDVSHSSTEKKVSPGSEFSGIGKYLPKGMLLNIDEVNADSNSNGSSKNYSRSNAKYDTNKQILLKPSRLPPGPKSTAFSDFSGW